MRVQVVIATVEPEQREAYLRAWTEWSGTLFAMELRAELLESETLPGSFVELNIRLLAAMARASGRPT